MGQRTQRKLVGYLPLVFLTTFLVVVVPMLLVLWLRLSGLVTPMLAGMLIGIATSFGVAYAGGAFWKTRTDSSDILFSELMPWGWVQRWRSERRLAAASDLLGLTTSGPQAIPGGVLTNEHKADLLTQLTSGLEARDLYTHGHSRRVARHAANIAKRMGLSREEVAKVRAAGAMHDVGKVDTPISVLHKEGKLTDEEFAIIKRHPVDGALMVATLDDAELTAMVRHHHERLDGTGYPDGLRGEEIPVGARIIAVADTFDAITSTRPYRHAHAHKKALDIISAEAGTQLDPDAVRAFCSCYSGRRPLAIWTVIAHGRPRLASFLGGGLSTANAGPVASVMSTAAAAAAVGAAAISPVVGASPASERTVAKAPAHASAKSRPESKPKAGGSAARKAATTSPESKPADKRRGRKGGRRKPRAAYPKPVATSKPPSTPVQSVAYVAPSDGGGYSGATAPEKPGQSQDGGGRKEPNKGKANGQGKGKANGQGKGKANGQGKGKANGQGKDKANGHDKQDSRGGPKDQKPTKGKPKDEGSTRKPDSASSGPPEKDKGKDKGNDGGVEGVPPPEDETLLQGASRRLTSHRSKAADR